MSGRMASVRRFYGVPVKRGLSVAFQGHPARIKSSTGSHICLRFEDPALEKRYGHCIFHPLDGEIDYLDGVNYRAEHDARVEAFVERCRRPSRAAAAGGEK